MRLFSKWSSALSDDEYIHPIYGGSEEVPTTVASLGIILDMMREYGLPFDVASIIMQNVFATQFSIEMYLPFTTDDKEAMMSNGDSFSRFMNESAVGQMNPIIVTGPKTKLEMIIAFEKKADAAIFRMQFLTR